MICALICVLILYLLCECVCVCVFFTGVGLSSDTVFHTTVQVYTAHSVIEHLSTDGVSGRALLQPGSPVSITNTLLLSLKASLLEAGFGRASGSNPLQHHILTFRR